jgi:hypothetical protein
MFTLAQDMFRATLQVPLSILRSRAASYLYLHSRPSDIIREGKLNNSSPATNLPAKRTQDGCRQQWGPFSVAEGHSVAIEL